jgi:hypothetical protein
MFLPKSSFARVGIDFTYGQIHMHAFGSPVKIQNPKHWNLIGGCMKFQSPVPSPSIVLPPLPSYCSLIFAKKNSVCLSKVLLFHFLILFKLCNAKLLKPVSLVYFVLTWLTICNDVMIRQVKIVTLLELYFLSCLTWWRVTCGVVDIGTTHGCDD